MEHEPIPSGSTEEPLPQLPAVEHPLAACSEQQPVG